MKLKLFIVLAISCLASPLASLANPAHEQSKASGKPPHGGGSGGSGGGTVGGLPYATASTVSQLIADITYANQAGGAVTINLASGGTFDLKSANNTIDGGNGFPVVGGSKPVALTIIGNAATIQRIGVFDKYYIVKNPFRFFTVAPGSSLTLDHVTLKGGGWNASGGAVLNRGVLNLTNGSILTDNYANSGGGICNAGGTATISSNAAILGNSAGSSGGGIYNDGGTVTIGSNILSNNFAFSGGGVYNNGGTVVISNGALSGNGARFGGGIYNSGGSVTISNGSILSGNEAYHADYPWAGGDGAGIYNDNGIVRISNSTLNSNTADMYFGSGGGIYNTGEVTVENYSSISENAASDLGADVNNLGVLYLDSFSVIGILNGNPAIPF
jgi:hypothetical protein